MAARRPAKHSAEEVAALAQRYARTHKRIDVPEISNWLRMVKRRAIPVCRDQIALADHVTECFRTEELWIDTWRLQKYMGYSKFFFELRPEEKFATALWLCTYKADGTPRWPEILYYVGRGYGKTGMDGYWAFCLMSPANGIRDYDVDVCATTADQAKLSYEDLRRMMDSDEELWNQGFKWNLEEMTSRETGSRFKFWSGNSTSKDGMRSGCVLFDEEHAYTDTKSMEVFEGGLGKKLDPRICKTTTDGDVRDGPLDEDKARAEAILFKGQPDGGFLPMLFRLDSPEEIEDERKWPKANPALLDRPVLRAQYRRDVTKWRETPDMHTSVPTKRFNLPTLPKAAAIADWEDLTACIRDRGELDGLACVVGIDFAKTTDMVGACALYRDGATWAAEIHAWWTTKSLDASAVKAPLDKWAQMGLLTMTDEPEVAPETVAEWVRNVAQRHEVRRVGIDSYRYTIMRRALADAGFEPYNRREGTGQVVLCRPSDVMRVQPVISAAFATKSLAWGDNPMARWFANNAKLEPRANGNYVYGKQEPHGRKTDGFSAMVQAFCVSECLDEQRAAPVELMQPLIF